MKQFTNTTFNNNIVTPQKLLKITTPNSKRKHPVASDELISTTKKAKNLSTLFEDTSYNPPATPSLNKYSTLQAIQETPMHVKQIMIIASYLQKECYYF